MKNNLGTLEQDNGNFYKDSHKRTILVDAKQHKGYIVPKEQFAKIVIFEYRILLSVILGIFIGNFVNYIYGIIAFIIAAIGLTYYYKKVVLKGLQCIEDIEIPEKRTYSEELQSEEKGTIIFKIILSFALVGLVIANYVMEKDNYTGINLTLLVIGSIIIVCVGLYLAFLSIKSLVRKINK